MPTDADTAWLEALRRFEIDFPEDFAEREVRPWGLLFHCQGNPLSYDSNHAIVLDLGHDLDEVVRQIVSFYQDRSLTPRVYSGAVPGEVEALRPALDRTGFRSEDYPLRWFFLEGTSRVDPDPALEVRRVRALDDAIVGLTNSDGEEPWTVGVLERHLRCDRFHLLVGYVEGVPVTKASLKLMDGIGRVDDVFTHPKHRGHGYARTLMHHLVQCHRRLTSGPLYLWAENPTAIRVYEDVGFVEHGSAPLTWSAWLP